MVHLCLKVLESFIFHFQGQLLICAYVIIIIIIIVIIIIKVIQ